MTDQEEAAYIERLSRLTKIDPATVQNLLNMQMAVFLLDLVVKKEAETVYGKTLLRKDGDIDFEKPNTQLRRLRSIKEVTKKLITETPHDLL